MLGIQRALSPRFGRSGRFYGCEISTSLSSPRVTGVPHRLRAECVCLSEPLLKLTIHIVGTANLDDRPELVPRDMVDLDDTR